MSLAYFLKYHDLLWSVCHFDKAKHILFRLPRTTYDKTHSQAVWHNMEKKRFKTNWNLLAAVKRKKHKFCKPFKLKYINYLLAGPERQCETASTTGRGIRGVRNLCNAVEGQLRAAFWLSFVTMKKGRGRKWNFVDSATDAWLKFSFNVFLLTNAEMPISNGLLKLKLIDRVTITNAVGSG